MFWYPIPIVPESFSVFDNTISLGMGEFSFCTATNDLYYVPENIVLEESSYVTEIYP